MADVIYIDFDDGVKRVMNNKAIYIKLLNKFKDDPSMSGIESAMAAGDMEKAQVSTHTLKGLAGNLSLTELFKQSLELETQIKAKDVNPDQLNTVKNVYTETLAEVERAIAQYG